MRYIRGHRHKKIEMPPGLNPSGLCECGCGEFTPLATKTRAKEGTVKGRPVRFVRGHWNRVEDEPAYDVDVSTGCWLWTGYRDKRGYGHIRRGDRGWLVHRWMYQLHVEPVGEDLHLHHRCGVPSCINPAHLEPLTPDQHLKRHAVARALTAQ